MSKRKSNIAVKEAPVVQVAPVSRDDKGRINKITMSMVEWDDVCKTKGLKTKSSMIRHLASEGYSPSAIAKFLGVIYQHVRNVLTKTLKRPVNQINTNDAPSTDANNG